MTLRVSLPSKLEQLVQSGVQSGLYKDTDALIEEALQHFFEGPNAEGMRDWSIICAEVKATLQRLDSGEEQVLDGEEVFADMATKFGLEE